MFQETLIDILRQVEDGKLTAISAGDKIKVLVSKNLPSKDEISTMAQKIYAKGEVKNNTFEEGFISGVSTICDYITDK